MDFVHNSGHRIEWLSQQELRSRKVVRRSNFRVTGKYPSWKSGRMMQWESTLERDAFFLLDADPSVISFHEQPVRISYYLDGVMKEHFPDVLANHCHKSSLLEVKTDKEGTSEAVISRSNLMASMLPSDIQYKVVTEAQIRLEPRLSNAKLLLRHGRLSVNHQAQQQFLHRYFADGACTFGKFLEGESAQHNFSLACRMLLEGTLSVDIYEEISPATKLYLKTEMKEASPWL